MFKYKNITPNYKGLYVGGQLYAITYYDSNRDRNQTLCLMASWTLGCCGARSLFQFDFPPSFWTEEVVDEFFQFLDEIDTDLYFSREVYFLLSYFQKQMMKPFLAYDGMKEIDNFTNRGTGGKGAMTLYRWSSSMEDLDEDDEDEEDF